MSADCWQDASLTLVCHLEGLQFSHLQEDMGLKIASAYSIPCACGQVYIRYDILLRGDVICMRTHFWYLILFASKCRIGTSV
jgi:hypothetical protein